MVSALPEVLTDRLRPEATAVLRNRRRPILTLFHRVFTSRILHLDPGHHMRLQTITDTMANAPTIINTVAILVAQDAFLK